MPITVRDMIKELKKDGWSELPGNGSGHRQFKHSTKLGRVTVSGQLSHDIPTGTEKSIRKQAGL